jgi:hypothetical protein
LPSTAIKATPVLFLALSTTTPVSTKREAWMAWTEGDSPAALGLGVTCPPPKPFASACESTLKDEALGEAMAAVTGATGPRTNFSAQKTALPAASSQTTNVARRFQRGRCIRLLSRLYEVIEPHYVA